MKFILSLNTNILYKGNSRAVKNAVKILQRDMDKRFKASDCRKNAIILTVLPNLDDEEFYIDAADEMTIYAKDELGFIYGLLYISKTFLGIKPFWFWMDQKIEKTNAVSVEYGRYISAKPAVKYRGWFVNDEVLIMKWNIGGDSTEPWRMVFEALLRCGGNMVIPGTDKNSKKYRHIASDMGLWITHHHAEPLGAEMFTRLYPNMEPNYAETPELFHKLWADGIIEQKDLKVVWCLGFRGQGDCPFWSHDSSGRFDTPAKRGKLISEIIELQRQLVMKYVDNPVFCTNLYGEIMELYDEGYITLADDIIKISADNGYGKMVTRRRDNHTVRISAMPKEKIRHGGIYYHVSFYDLQAANHITMLPNSVDFVDRELTEVINKNAVDYWIINCSNVRPHAYYLDAIRKKWFGENISDKTHSQDFISSYFDGNALIAEAYRDYHKAMPAYGFEEDEHAGEQFYTENVRLLVHSFFNEKFSGTPGLKWLTGEHPL
ncbi:MAG: glycosyl hydrolase 115 family protein, partial [bacterium]|nr:glycosyl hydrolase 115 family protein [bacterium]